MSNIYAAIDLGSNSFHMIIAQDEGGHLLRVDQLRESVRLAFGLDSRNNLSEASQQQALECLERFGQRLRELPISNVRAVGTNTLRKANNSRAFIKKAQKALGHPIEIIAGVEEARIIYLGVSHSLPASDDSNLVVDIGGGSTEVIIGRNFEPIDMESTYMGCVSFSDTFFKDGEITRERMKSAVMAARLELQPHKRKFKKIGWNQAVGASGTIKAVGEIVNQMGWSNDEITHQSMKQLIDAMVDLGHVDKLTELKGLKEERLPVIAGGAAVLMGIFHALKIERMTVSSWALREGLIYDMLGRNSEEDVRERTINNLCERYQVDEAQSARIAITVLSLFDQVANRWSFDISAKRCLLEWAVRLHEIGIGIAHSGYHKHGYYLLANLDMPGFSKTEQSYLAVLVRAHRRKFPKTVFKGFGKSVTLKLKRLAVLIRIAVLLHRSRADNVPLIGISVNSNTITLSIGEQWLSEHPLTEADLNIEAELLKVAGFNLIVKTTT